MRHGVEAFRPEQHGHKQPPRHLPEPGQTVVSPAALDAGLLEFAAVVSRPARGVPVYSRRRSIRVLKPSSAIRLLDASAAGDGACSTSMTSRLA
mmetsp:Transcript_29312/g.50179  ORF Transcript_29312/g.50179 Transcript_29312/m.50179 type:complete len:94 (-) Transcript_29312:620-901(-)